MCQGYFVPSALSGVDAYPGACVRGILNITYVNPNSRFPMRGEAHLEMGLGSHWKWLRTYPHGKEHYSDRISSAKSPAVLIRRFTLCAPFLHSQCATLRSHQYALLLNGCRSFLLTDKPSGLHELPTALPSHRACQTYEAVWNMPKSEHAN